METWDDIKDHVVIMMHNKDIYDEEVLEKITYLSPDFSDDIYASFYIDKSEEKDGKDITLITNKHLSEWKIPFSVLDAYAFNNMMKISFYCETFNSNNIINGNDEEEIFSIYSIDTNTNYGAFVITLKENLDKITDLFGSSCYFVIMNSNLVYIYPDYLITEDVLAHIAYNSFNSEISKDIFYYNAQSRDIIKIRFEAIEAKFNMRVKSSS